MRFIDRDSIIPAVQQLINDSETASNELLQLEPNDRDSYIDNHRQIWVSFRPHLEQISHGKCWYTESINPGTDDDVDHFRPKGSLADDDNHGGYWWEALDWRNFRLSCHRANRLRRNPETGNTHGKGDHFPLLNEADRCRVPTDDLARERPRLLDPINPFDPPLLTFSIDGTIAVSAEFANDPDAALRIEASRIYLHLEWPKFKDQRQELYNNIVIKITDGEHQARRLPNGDVGSREALISIARDLVNMTKDDQPYSRAAKAYIENYRHIWWIKDSVLPNCH